MRELPQFIKTPTPEMYLDASKALVLDFETTNIEKGSALNPDNRIVLAVWRTGHRHHYKWGGEMEQEELVKALTATISHDAKVTVSEAELLRAVCAILHCPLPPFVLDKRTG